MRLASLIFLFAGFSRIAAAAWSELPEDLAKSFAIHTDPATVYRADNFVRMWVLFDYKTAQVVANQTYMSERVREEYDCRDARIRVLQFSDHAEKMAGGKVVLRTFLPGEWEPVEPGSVNEVLWKLACTPQKNAQPSQGMLTSIGIPRRNTGDSRYE